MCGSAAWAPAIHSRITALTGGHLRRQKLKRTGEVGTPAGVG